ncbi:hypothetical protein XF14_03195 [Burkholderia gladioli]|nr:hypothetical protein XF14_03195 [Burkholderia gladioli]
MIRHPADQRRVAQREQAQRQREHAEQTLGEEQQPAPRSRRSAAKPLSAISRICGANCRAITMPTARALWWLSPVSTSQACAVRCIQVPMFDTRAPPAQRR